MKSEPSEPRELRNSNDTGTDNRRKVDCDCRRTRLEESRTRRKHWKRWGPYLSERAWGTVREDYSPYGTAWDYFPHDHARSRAYRWNEDGLAGICDRHQNICFALALWNGRDPILKERLFGLTGTEGNHGEDVKEYYFYLDSTPTHSYMKYLYKYPQAEFPYAQLVDENRRRGKHASRVRADRHRRLRRGPVLRRRRRICEGRRRRHPDPDHRRPIADRRPPPLHLLPTIWFRNTWSWEHERARSPRFAQSRRRDARDRRARASRATVSAGCTATDAPELLFTENETNTQRLFDDAERHALRQGRHQRLHRHGIDEAVNPEQRRHQGGGALPR